MLTRVLRPDAPIDLVATMSPLQAGRGDPTMRIDHDHVLRATRTPDGPATGRYRAQGERIVVDTWGPGAEWLAEAAFDLVGCADDPHAFAPAMGDQPLRDLHRHNPGLRLTTTGTVFEVLLATILAQKVTAIAAKRSWHALVKRHSEPAPGPQQLWLPPAPATIAALPYHAFHPLNVERKRADAIRFAAGRVVRIEETADMDRTDRWQRLTAFPGIGPWTAGKVARLCFGDPDAVEVGDFHVPDVVAWNLAGEARADDTRMLQLLEPYAGQRGRVVRLLKLGGDRPPRFGPRLAPRRLQHL